MDRVDFSEVFTVAARQVVPTVLAKAQSFSFDHRGPRISFPIDASRLRRTLHRILCGAIDCLQSGFIMFVSDTEVRGADCLLTVTAAGTGKLVRDDVIEGVLERLELHAVPSAARATGARTAIGRCAITGAALEFSCLPSEGALLRATLWPEDVELLDDDDSDMVGFEGTSRAWLIGAEAVADSLTRRLQRLRWATTRFDSCAHAQVQLSQASSRSRRPDLVVVQEFDGATPESVVRLREMLPATTTIAYCVASGSATLRQPDVLPGCDLHVYPFSPAELLHYTHESRPRRMPRSGETAITPLLFSDRRLVLVADDNELNRVVACGLLEALGYETTTACHGLEAIDQCRRWAPHAVLMDIDMPVLGGLGATRELRRLQRLGEVSPCAIVAATASGSSTRADRCFASGMDGYLCKPLTLATLRDELRRFSLS